MEERRMNTARSKFYWLLAGFMIISTLLSACQPQVVTQVVTQPPQVVTQQVEVTRAVEVTRQVDVQVTAEPGALPYGLKPGKPYDGTKLKFLICCRAAAQFFLLSQKSLAFTELTGIEVEWGDVPFGEFQTLTQQEGVSGAGGYDLVTWVDVWVPVCSTPSYR